MKQEYPNIPQSMASMETYGFSWMDLVSAIPAPLFVNNGFDDDEIFLSGLTAESASVVRKHQDRGEY